MDQIGSRNWTTAIRFIMESMAEQWLLCLQKSDTLHNLAPAYLYSMLLA